MFRCSKIAIEHNTCGLRRSIGRGSWQSGRSAGRRKAGGALSAGLDDGADDTNQRRELQAVAARHGWEVVQVSPTTAYRAPRGKDRPGLDALLKGVARREFDMVAAWSVDRLGRSLQDLIEVLSDLHAKGVDLYLHQQGLDTSTPSGRAMYQMMGVFAEFERAIIRERVLSGLARAKAEGITLGRPSIEDSNAGKYEPSRRRWRRKAFAGLPASYRPASARCCGSRRSWRCDQR